MLLSFLSSFLRSTFSENNAVGLINSRLSSQCWASGLSDLEAHSVFGLSDKGDIIMGGNLKRD